jgi:hypothetical protein
MSRDILGIPGIATHTSAWARLLEETNDEILASQEISEQEKRWLVETDNQPEAEREPGLCLGKPASETIIEDRGER